MKSSPSLTRLIITRVVVIIIIFTACRFFVVNTEVGSLLDRVKVNSMTNWLWEVGSYLGKDSKNRLVLNIPPPRALLFAEPGIDYMVRDQKGKILFHSPEPWVNYTPPKIPERNSIHEFEFRGPDGHPFVGQSGWVIFDKKPYIIQITLSEDFANKFTDQLGRAFFYKYTALTILFLGLLILSIIFSIRQSLKPLNDSSREAQEISFMTPGSRLSTDRLPAEIKPLVKAFNMVLERLEGGIVAQKEFTAHAAHELRTPLSLLQAQIDLLDDKTLKEKLGSDVKIMSRLVKQLLATARLEHADGIVMERTDLAAVVRDACLALWPMMLSQSVRLEVSGVDEPIWIKGNADSIDRALRNVLENALRHTPKETVINVDVSDHQIRIRDGGPGVADEDKGHIFEMFWRKKLNNNEGAGIGLYIVRTTMKFHGGSVHVEDARGGGSVFVLTFPSTAVKA